MVSLMCEGRNHPWGIFGGVTTQSRLGAMTFPFRACGRLCRKVRRRIPRIHVNAIRSASRREMGVVIRSVTTRQTGPSRVPADRDLIGNHRLVPARGSCGSADRAAQELGPRAVVRG